MLLEDEGPDLLLQPGMRLVEQLELGIRSRQLGLANESVEDGLLALEGGDLLAESCNLGWKLKIAWRGEEESGAGGVWVVGVDVLIVGVGVLVEQRSVLGGEMGSIGIIVLLKDSFSEWLGRLRRFRELGDGGRKALGGGRRGRRSACLRWKRRGIDLIAGEGKGLKRAAMEDSEPIRLARSEVDLLRLTDTEALGAGVAAEEEPPDDASSLAMMDVRAA
jgi:hypothetical protein